MESNENTEDIYAGAFNFMSCFIVLKKIHSKYLIARYKDFIKRVEASKVVLLTFVNV